MNIIELIQNILCGNRECPDTDYLTERIKTLSEELALCIGPIDLTEETQTSINPHHIIKGYDLTIADAEYLTYTFDDWKSIMFRLHQHLVDKFKYVTDVGDCDDFALVYTSTLAYSAYQAGLSKQVAFGIAWSNTHAFNVAIDDKNNVWVIEPQSGSVIGELGTDLGESYNVKKIWFLS